MRALDRSLPRHAQRSSWMRWGGMAAGVLIAFAAGWLGNAQWSATRAGAQLAKAPDLSSLGYTLVGGRLLPGETGARAQFMFEDAAGERVTLYIGTLDDRTAGTAALRETAFRFASEGPVPSFYWVDQGFGYAVAGKLPRDVLLKLATLTYRDLS